MEDRTLTERVQRLEGMMGIACEENSARDQVATGVTGEDIQRRYNARVSRRIDRDHAKVGACHREHASPSTQQTALEEVISRIQSSTNRILERACVLEAIGNRIMGSFPEEKTETADGSRGSEGTLDHTHLALDGLDYACSRLDAAALRLGRV